MLQDQRTIVAEWRSTEDCTGSINFADNSEYKGDIRKGLRNGIGEFHDYSKSYTYKGFWMND